MLNALLYKDSTRGSSDTSDDAPAFPGDIFPGDGGEDEVPKELLYARSGKLIYKEGFGMMLWTWWDFDQSSKNLHPIAYINGENRCGGHSTTHIIDYMVTKKNFSGRGSTVTMYVNMVMGDDGSESGKWDGSAPCVHRLWGGASTYAQATADHRAEKSGTCGGGATFKVTYDLDKDDYKIT